MVSLRGDVCSWLDKILKASTLLLISLFDWASIALQIEFAVFHFEVPTVRTILAPSHGSAALFSPLSREQFADKGLPTNTMCVCQQTTATYNNLLEAAGANLFRSSFMMHNGTALIATITATFQANPVVITKERSRPSVNKRKEIINRQFVRDDDNDGASPKYSGRKAILIT